MASSKKQKGSYSVNKLARWLFRSVWLFPAVLTVILIGLTALRISGSSIGIYHELFYGQQAKDPNLLYGDPQPIRSDEWLVNTQLLLAQEANNYKRINENIGTSRDMSFNIDVPAKDWSAPFKPQNLVFFAVPFEHAFAFKWWILLYLLILGAYFFTLRLFPGKRLLAAVAALGLGFSPFIHWWYLNGTISPLVYGFFIILISMRILNDEPIPVLKKYNVRYSYALYTLVLAYLLVGFGLVLYPPFQIPVAIAVAIFMFGYLLEKYFDKRTKKKAVAKRLAIIAAASVLAGGIMFAFLKTHSEPLERISNSVYPGKRVVSSGTLEPKFVLTSYLQPQLQRDSRANFYYNNPSEASNFILIMPLLLLPGFALMGYEWKKKKRIDWILVSLQAGSLLLFARVFLAFGDPFYKLLFLHVVPNERLLIGIGFIGFLQMLYVMKKMEIVKIAKWWPKVAIVAYSLLWFVVLIWLGLQIRQEYPKFISSLPLIVAGALVLVLIPTLILLKKNLLAMLVFFGFSLFSVYGINPLYVGLGPIKNNRLSTQIKALSKEEDTWATLDYIYLENFGSINDRDSITGVQFYPDLDFWRQVGGKKYDYVYNRYAHVLFSSSPELKDKLYLIQQDSFAVKFECSNFVKNNVRFTLSTYRLNSSCTQLVDEIRYPAITFFIYSVSKN